MYDSFKGLSVTVVLIIILGGETMIDVYMSDIAYAYADYAETCSEN